MLRVSFVTGPHCPEDPSFYSSILNVKVGEKSRAAIVKDIQRHPSKKQIIHIDLQRIVEDEQISSVKVSFSR